MSAASLAYAPVYAIFVRIHIHNPQTLNFDSPAKLLHQALDPLISSTNRMHQTHPFGKLSNKSRPGPSLKLATLNQLVGLFPLSSLEPVLTPRA